MCAKFQFDWYTLSCFIASVRNEEKAQEKTRRAKNEILLARILELAGVFASNSPT